MPSTTIGICLFELPEKDQTVIQRVITFGASQGKHYSLQTEISSAQIIIALDSTALPSDHQAVTIRIGEADNLASDLLLQRPLLVTRVMRAIDDAAQLYRSRPTIQPKEDITNSSNQPITAAQQPEKQALPPTTESDLIKSTDSSQTSITSGSIPADRQETETSETSLDNKQEIVTAIKTEAEEEPATPSEATHPEEEAVKESSIAEAGEEETYSHFALVVDDSAAIRKQLEIELRNAHIKADFAETGEEALEKSAQTQYDLVFLDIIMPGIDGYEVCRQMRARKSMKKTPIIMLSAKTSPLDEVQGVIAGASTYLTKPVKHEQFQQTLKRVSKWLSEFAR